VLLLCCGVLQHPMWGRGHPRAPGSTHKGFLLRNQSYSPSEFGPTAQRNLARYRCWTELAFATDRVGADQNWLQCHWPLYYWFYGG
jgi:hypothetical protein